MYSPLLAFIGSKWLLKIEKNHTFISVTFFVLQMSILHFDPLSVIDIGKWCLFQSKIKLSGASTWTNTSPPKILTKNSQEDINQSKSLWIVTQLRQLMAKQLSSFLSRYCHKHSSDGLLLCAPIIQNVYASGYLTDRISWGHIVC